MEARDIEGRSNGLDPMVWRQDSLVKDVNQLNSTANVPRFKSSH
jgi:hypothetical protein